MNYRYLNHKNIEFYVESFLIEGAFETKTKWQCLVDEGYALSEICEDKATAIEEAICNINKNLNRLK